MMKCSEAARMVSDEMNRDLGFRRRLSLRMHLLMCAGCRHYERQLRLMRRWMRSGRLDDSDRLPGGSDSPHLEADARRRIGTAIEARLGGDFGEWES